MVFIELCCNWMIFNSKIILILKQPIQSSKVKKNSCMHICIISIKNICVMSLQSVEWRNECPSGYSKSKYVWGSDASSCVQDWNHWFVESLSLPEESLLPMMSCIPAPFMQACCCISRRIRSGDSSRVCSHMAPTAGEQTHCSPKTLLFPAGLSSPFLYFSAF